jgi:hypothetical protein
VREGKEREMRVRERDYKERRRERRERLESRFYKKALRVGGESGQVVWVFQVTSKKARNECRLTDSIFLFYFYF